MSILMRTLLPYGMETTSEIHSLRCEICGTGNLKHEMKKQIKNATKPRKAKQAAVSV